jgi:hypothetical protein
MHADLLAGALGELDDGQAISPNSSHSNSTKPKTLQENKKRAAGIGSGSSAWKAEPLFT